METQDPKTAWVGALFDVSQPYLYVVVLPALAMFALGYRGQAIVFGLGSLGLIAFMNAG